MFGYLQAGRSFFSEIIASTSSLRFILRNALLLID
jgi:hypothetical protein